MEIEIDYILTNLKILSLVKINQKVCIYKGHLQIDYNPLQFIKRWFNRDSRESLICFLNDLIKKIDELFKVCKCKNENPDSICSILNEMDKINNGINNLKITYTNDPIIVVKLDTICLRLKSLSTAGRTLLI
jgi:hypothetical protein